MKKKLLKNIPQKRLNELNLIIKIIKEKLLQKHIEIDKIILFWSYARWDFIIEDIKEKEEFRSDFDILIITKKDLWEEMGILEMYLIDFIKYKKKIKVPLTLIIDNLNHINTMLKMWRYFYTDIKREWILLFDNSWIDLIEHKIITKKEKLKTMKEDYEMWFPKWWELLKNYKLYSKNLGAFQLHQATEMYITAYLLVKTWYKEKTHDLEHLYINLKHCDKIFENWFEFKNKWEYEKSRLLRESYIRARYDKDFIITKLDLKFLEEKILNLRDLIEKLCKEEMEKLI